MIKTKCMIDMFSEPMILAILDGRKTQSRRVVNPKLLSFNGSCYTIPDDSFLSDLCPYREGDRLWLKEPWAAHWNALDHDNYIRPGFRKVFDANVKQENGSIAKASPEKPIYVHYKADNPEQVMSHVPWRSAKSMPQWASRITVEILKIRIEKLQNISEEDAIAEGCGIEINTEYGFNARPAFVNFWNSKNIKRGYGWDANPWVSVTEFVLYKI